MCRDTLGSLRIPGNACLCVVLIFRINYNLELFFPFVDVSSFSEKGKKEKEEEEIGVFGVFKITYP